MVKGQRRVVYEAEESIEVLQERTQLCASHVTCFHFQEIHSSMQTSYLYFYMYYASII